MARVEVYERTDAEEVFALDEASLDPNLAYRWVDERKVGKRRRQGYEVVLRKESGVELLHEQGGQSPDDTLRVGTMVLMACDKKLYDERRRRYGEQARRRLSAGEDKFKSAARKRGVNIVTEGE